MHLQDVDAAELVRPVDQHLPVEAPRTQQRGVQDLRPVGGGQDDQADRGVEAVHLDQQLVERLFLLVVATEARKRAAGPAQRIQLVDEDDRRGQLARLLEQVAHPRRADPDEHLDELAARDREERHPGLSRHRLGQQRLARPRRPDQQHALRDVGAEPAVLLRVLQEIDHLLQFRLGLVDPGHVGEGHPGVRLDIDLGPALADRHETAQPALLAGEAPEHEVPEPEEHGPRHDPRQQVAQEGVGDHPGVGHAELLQPCRQLRLDPCRHQQGPRAIGHLQATGDRLVGDGDLGDAALGQRLLERAVGHGLDLADLVPEVLRQGQQHQRDQPVADIPGVFLVHVLPISSAGWPSARTGRKRGPMHVTERMHRRRHGFTVAVARPDSSQSPRRRGDCSTITTAPPPPCLMTTTRKQ